MTGASGFLGRCIAGRLAPEGRVAFTHCRTPCFPASVRYDFFRDDIAAIVDGVGAAVVIFAASVERGPSDDVRSSMERFLRACRARRIVYLSSDGVFDGEKGCYTEQDTPAPRTPYGRNLLLCETLIRERCSDHCIVRPSYIYGFSAGQLDRRLARTRDLLTRGQEVRLYDDMYKSPLGVDQVAEAVIRLAASGFKGVVHVAGIRLSVFEFHHQAMEAMGIDPAEMKRCSMPVAAEMLRDTSMDGSLWQKLTDMRPHSIGQTLSSSVASR